MLSINFSEFYKLLGSEANVHSLPNKTVRGVAVDSRLIQPNDVFFAIPGARVDGHLYLQDAAKAGAAGAVVLSSYQGPDFGLFLIRVNDVLTALQNLAANFLKTLSAKIIAVTGSVGKTTTKDFITHLLKTRYKVASSPGNSNSQIGLPLTVLNHVTGNEDFIVLEMGMTHRHQIERLIQIAPPQYAVLTSVDYAHACNFASLDEIACAKAEIFLSPHTILGILPIGLPNFNAVYHSGVCKKLTFSTADSKADYFLEEAVDKMIVHARGENIPLPIPAMLGKHNTHNLLAAISLAREVGIDWSLIAAAIPTLSLPERRLQPIEKNGILFINDCYNAIPVAVKASLCSLPAPKQGCKRIFVMGEMLELGSMSEKMHREVADLALSCVDRMICYGEGCKPVVERWKEAGRQVDFSSDFDKIYSALKAQMLPGDVVLLKGAQSKGLWRILEYVEAGK